LESNGGGRGAASDPGVKHGQGDGSGNEEQGKRFVSRTSTASGVEVRTIANPDRRVATQIII